MSHMCLEIEGNVAILTLDNPPQNRIGDQMVEEFAAAIHQVLGSQVRALLVRAEGPDFSFGGDIVTWPDMDQRQLRAAFDRYMSVFNRFERLPIPVVAAVQGLCFGGGFELALRADMIVAADNAQFGHPEQSIGIVTVLGGIYRVAERAGRALASEWALTSERIPADAMARHGVINRVVPEVELLIAARALAEKAANGPTRAYAAHKALLRTWAEAGVAAADSAMLDIAMPLFETADAQGAIPSAVNALREGRPRPAFPFAGR